ncbi:MAG: T9SS C-terminal target domain-containing protein, partial [Bacteroidota bacterium]
MKKIYFLIAFALISFSAKLSAQTIVIKDSVATSQTWTNDHIYLIQGFVYVVNGVTLTIQPGTIIMGDHTFTGSSLIIEKGGKINAIGTPIQPIVFTSDMPAGSRTRGDWGGIILCGKAPINPAGGSSQVEGGPRSFYGGTDSNDNSGTLQYVRIEFAGYPFQVNKEINGLTFGGVGKGTTIDHIQVSYSNDDSYEWFGGKVNCKYLIAFRGLDDEFDTDYGFSGKLQYLVALRDSAV